MSTREKLDTIFGGIVVLAALIGIGFLLYQWWPILLWLLGFASLVLVFVFIQALLKSEGVVIPVSKKTAEIIETIFGIIVVLAVLAGIGWLIYTHWPF